MVEKQKMKQPKEKTYKKQVKIGTFEREIELSEDVLKEAMDPALSVDHLWIPPFNAKIDYRPGQPTTISPKRDARRLFIFFLTGYYEDKLYSIARPVLEEANNMLAEFQSKGGVKAIDWSVDLGDVLQGLVLRLTGAVYDYNRTLATAASIITEASIVLDRVYRSESPTEEDRALISLFTPEYFLENVPAEYILKHIIIPQYRKTGIADLVGIFFSKLTSIVLSGVGSMMPGLLGSTTSVSSEAAKHLADFMPSDTVTQELNSLLSATDPE